MKRMWLRLEARIDALSLRERALVFLVAALVLVTLINTFLLDPMFADQKLMAQNIRQSQQQIGALQQEIRNRVSMHEADPDAPLRERLAALRQQSAVLRQELQGVQRDFVPPEKMAVLLEEILRRNGRLQLMALKTLPVSLLHDAAPQQTRHAQQTQDGNAALSASKNEPSRAAGGSAAMAKTASTAAPATDRIYRHGVELVVQGSYADIMQTLAQLESMPWRLFWENVSLGTEAYPVLRLKLTVFTLSLDENWLNL